MPGVVRYLPMSSYRRNKPVQKLITGYRPVVRAREGRMLGIRQPLDGPIFDKLEAEFWCVHAMISHFDRRLGMSDATIEPFNGLVDCAGPPSDPARFRGIARICEQVAKTAGERLNADENNSRKM